MGTGVTFQICSPEILVAAFSGSTYKVVVTSMHRGAVSDIRRKHSIRVVKHSSVSTG